MPSPRSPCYDWETGGPAPFLGPDGIAGSRQYRGSLSRARCPSHTLWPGTGTLRPGLVMLPGSLSSQALSHPSRRAASPGQRSRAGPAATAATRVDLPLAALCWVPQDRSVNSEPLASRAGCNLSGILLLRNPVPKTI